MKAEFNTFKEIIFNYRYLETNTWDGMEEGINTHAESMLGLFQDQSSIDETIKSTLICAAYLIWNKNGTEKYAALAENLLSRVLEITEEPLAIYFLAKLKFFQGKDVESLELFTKANSSIPAKFQAENCLDLKEIMLAMGCLSSDEQNVEQRGILSAIISNDLANLNLKLKDYTAAISNFSAAYTIQTSIYENQVHANIAYTLRCLAKAYLENGDVNLADEKIQQAQQIAKSTYAACDYMHYEMAEINYTLGDVRERQGATDEAIGYFAESLKVYRNIYSDASDKQQEFLVELSDRVEALKSKSSTLTM